MFWTFHRDDSTDLGILQDPLDGIEARIFDVIVDVDPSKYAEV
jgi:hypothetical protein